MQRSLAAIVLTDSKPQEIKGCVWAAQTSADLLANTEDLRYSFKTSSVACPFCGGMLEGDRDENADKKRPWECSVENLRHITPNADCPSEQWRKSPRGSIIERLLICHAITHAACAGVKAEDLHNDPGVPKLHAHWEGDELEWLEELAATPDAKASLFEVDAGKQKTLPSGQVQRVFCHEVPEKKTASWEESLRSFPNWSGTHPEDPDAPKVSGWIIVPTETGPKALCGYILPDEEPGDLPEVYPIPIYEIHGPEPLVKPGSDMPVAYAEASLQCGPAEEPLRWKEAATVKRLKKDEKNRRKQKLAAELEKLPKEKIWEGFNTAGKIDLAPGEGEPPQLLPGYRSGGDPKKWWLPGIGNPHAKIWVIGLYPSTEEIKRKPEPKILAGASGAELFGLVRAAGLNPATDVYFENLVKRYMPPKSKLGAELKMEQTWLLKKQLAHFQPERVICLGAEAFKEVVGDKSFQNFRATWVDVKYPRNPGAVEKWEGRAAGTFHPAGVLRPEGRHNLEVFRHDFRELLLDHKKTDIKPVIHEIKTIEEAREWIIKETRELEARGDDCVYTVDTESVSLDVQHDELLCIQISRIFGALDKKEGWFEPKEVPQRTDIFMLRENPEPDIYDADVFAEQNDQMSLFGETTKPAEPAGPPYYAVANTEEERKKLIETHGQKRKNKGLVIFTPYLRKRLLCEHSKELGEIFNELGRHRKCAGFGLTNANHDRIRLERELEWDLTLPGEHGGSHYPLDTMLAEHVLDENTDLGLKSCLNKHFNWPRQNIELDRYAESHNLENIKGQVADPARRSAWSLYPWRILRPYGGKDAYGAAALLAKQMEDISLQVLKYQKDRIVADNPNTLEKAFHISCGAINGTYEMNKMGMPIGEKGMKILKELTAFYAGHEETMVAEYKDAVFRLTGLRDANPNSPEELSYVLFNEASPLRKQGVEPWKESGRNGRLWSEIPREEQSHCTPSTDAESLEIIASNCENPELQSFLLRLSETKTILTIRSSFLADFDSGKGLIGRISPETLCMHTTYTPTLDTNRCRSVPNLSTFPKEEVEMVRKILGVPPPYKIREVVQAPEGTFLLNRDWTTAEVLGLGFLSQDPNMLAIVARMELGMDFHCKLAVQTYQKIRDTFARIAVCPTPDLAWLKSTFAEKTSKAINELWLDSWKDGPPTFPEEKIHKIAKKIFKQERSNIKPVTFGVPYGREAPAIMKQLNREYYVNNTRDAEGNLVTVTLEEAQAMIDSYKTGFSSAWGYLVDQAEHAKEHGFLRDHWGYIRHFPQGMKDGDITRKAYNYQIQHIVAVLMNQAMNEWVQERKKRKLRSYAYATLYDNIGWVVYEDELQEVWDLSMEVMTAKRPVGPAVGDLPVLNEWHIPTEGELSREWEGPAIKPESVGIAAHDELNKTGLEGKF